MNGQGGSRPKTALMVFAHPDDETLLAGALIAMLVQEGWRVHLLCVAPGDDSDLFARMELAALDLGVSSVSALRYATHPAGNPPDRSASMTIAGTMPPLLAAPEPAVASMIEGKMIELRPYIVVTHSPTGDYGHPDHAFCHRVTVLAARTALPSAEVYALAWPRWLLWLNSLAGKLVRPDRRRSAGPGPAVPEDVATASKLPVTHTHDVYRYLPTRKRAARHYRREMSQGPLPLRLLEAAPAWLQRPVLGKARLSRVR